MTQGANRCPERHPTGNTQCSLEAGHEGFHADWGGVWAGPSVDVARQELCDAATAWAVNAYSTPHDNGALNRLTSAAEDYADAYLRGTK